MSWLRISKVDKTIPGYCNDAAMQIADGDAIAELELAYYFFYALD